MGLNNPGSDGRAGIAGCSALLFLITCAVLPGSPVYAAGTTTGQIVLRAAVNADRPASLEELHDILIVRGGRSMPARPEMVLLPGDILSTGSLEAIITFGGDDSEVIVGSNSQVDILNPSIRAVVGEIVVKVKQSVARTVAATRDFFRVETDFGAAAAEGTIFYVHATSNQVGVRVFEGRVRLDPVAGGGGTLRLRSGETATMRQNETPTKRRMTQRQINEVISKVRRIERVISPYTGRVIEPPPPVRASSEDRKKLIRQAQRLLLSLGYDPGAIDGVEGRGTVAAVTAFKRQRNLTGPPRINQPLITALQQAKAELDETQPLPSIDRDSIDGLKTPPGGKVYTDEILSVDELIECIRLHQRIENLKNVLAKENARLEVLTKALQQKQEALDRTDEQAVRQYRSDVTNINARIENYNESAQQVRDLNATWGQRFSGRQYYIDDMVSARDTLRLDYVPGRDCGRRSGTGQ